ATRDGAAAGNKGVASVLGQGGGAFETRLHYGATGLPFAVAAGDFNGDGFTDLAVAGEHGGIAVLLNAADWPFAPPDETPPPRPPPREGAGFAPHPLRGGPPRGGRPPAPPRPAPAPPRP